MYRLLKFALAAYSAAVTALALGQSTAPTSAELNVLVIDSAHHALAGATVELHDADSVVRSGITTSEGQARFQNLTSTDLSVSVRKDGFEPIENTSVTVSSVHPTEIEITLTAEIQHKEQVNVDASADQLDQGSSAEPVATTVARELPSRPATVSDALPLLPGVVRSPQGSLAISGTGEHRSALIVNSADVTDPATGQFGVTVPIDSVETLNVYQTPFLAEYGRFTGGLVSVETRRGTDTWKWEINDPLPDFRIRSDHLRGIMDATPRLNVEGPLIEGKLYFSEGFEYEIRKVPVITLPFPDNQETTEGINSFSQFDYIVSSNQLLTATFHVAPQQLKSVNMNAFNPESTAPDASIDSETGTISDKLTVRDSDLLENSLSFTRFSAAVWAHGVEDLAITPEGNSGNYFAQQERDSSRIAWLSTYTVHPIDAWGAHNLKVGAYAAGSSEHAEITERPFDILDSAGDLLEQVSFTPGFPVHKTDTEMAFFGQDHWLLTPRIAIDVGARGESQATTETLRLAPRTGISWVPFANTGTVVHAGIGLFYDRVPLNVFGFPEYPNQVVTTYDASGNVLSGPITYLNTLGEVTSTNPFIFRQNRIGDFSPRSRNWAVDVEQRVSTAVKVRVSYRENDATGLVVMNPIPPQPGSTTGTMLLTGNGQSRYRQLELMSRIRLQGDKHQLFVSYVNSQARGDLNDFSNYLGTFPAPIIRPNEFGDLPTDLPNRFLAWGVFHLPCKIQIAPILEWRTGFPYLITNAAQAYVGSRYQERYPDFVSLDARASKDFKLNAKYTARVSLSANNITNHFNPDSVYSNTDAPLYRLFFGQHKRRLLADFDVFF